MGESAHKQLLLAVVVMVPVLGWVHFDAKGGLARHYSFAHEPVGNFQSFDPLDPQSVVAAANLDGPVEEIQRTRKQKWLGNLGQGGDEVQKAKVEKKIEGRKQKWLGNLGKFKFPDGPGWISGKAWHDLNDDGEIDDQEPFLPGTTVRLHAGNPKSKKTQLVNSKPLAEVTTNSKGRYVFEGVPSGLYFLHVIPTDGYVLSGKNRQIDPNGIGQDLWIHVATPVKKIDIGLVKSSGWAFYAKGVGIGFAIKSLLKDKHGPVTPFVP